MGGVYRALNRSSRFYAAGCCGPTSTGRSRTPHRCGIRRRCPPRAAGDRGAGAPVAPRWTAAAARGRPGPCTWPPARSPPVAAGRHPVLRGGGAPARRLAAIRASASPSTSRGATLPAERRDRGTGLRSRRAPRRHQDHRDTRREGAEEQANRRDDRSASQDPSALTAPTARLPSHRGPGRATAPPARAKRAEARPADTRYAHVTAPSARSGGRTWTDIIPTRAIPRARATPSSRAASSRRLLGATETEVAVNSGLASRPGSMGGTDCDGRSDRTPPT